MQNIIALIGKEVRLEWRNRTAFTGVLIYVAATVFICYSAFQRIIDPITWNALFWIILLFAAVNAGAKSFMQEPKGLQLFFYTFLDPQEVILAKIIYNTLLMAVIGLASFGFYALLLGNLAADVPMYLAGLLLGSTGFASVLTLVSAIASKTGNGASLMAILGFPLLLPLLMTLIRFSRNAIDGLSWTVNNGNLVILLAVNALVIALAYMLFPYLWKD